MFKQLFGGKSAVTLSKLPMLNTFIDVMVGGRAARQVTVESVGPKGIVTKEALGKVGETAVIVYQSKSGRYRAQTKIATVGAGSTQFETPRKVSLIGGAPSAVAGKRQSVQSDTIVTGTWRLAPGNVGKGDFVKATIRDVSRGGCSLIIDRALKLGTKVEVQLPLRDGTGVTLLGELMRHEQIKTSGKHSHGLRFHGIRPGEDQAIVGVHQLKSGIAQCRGLA